MTEPIPHLLKPSCVRERTKRETGKRWKVTQHNGKFLCEFDRLASALAASKAHNRAFANREAGH